MGVPYGQPWFVEAVQLGRDGSGYEVRHGDDVRCLTGVDALARFLASENVDPILIATPDTGLPVDEDGCE